jgi:SPP1 gp7 family putative phage head morphogenesis protein
MLVGRTRLLSEHLRAQVAHRMTDGGLSRAEAEDVLAQVRNAIANLLVPRRALTRVAEAVGVFANRIADRQGIPRPLSDANRRMVALLTPGSGATPRQVRDAADDLRADQKRRPAVRLAKPKIATPPIPDALRDQWIRDNVSLIGGMQAKWYADVEAVIRDAAAKGLAPSAIEKAIARESGKFGRHAKLIAQDQIGKLNGKVAEYRQTSAGITSYRWSTSRDERVRRTHKALEGSVQSWASPPVSESNGERNHPGGAVRCRCSAVPLLTGSALEGLGLD